MEASDIDAYRRLIESWVNGHNMPASNVIEALDALFPERSPLLTDSLDKIRYDSGARSVVNFLKGQRHD
jgi:transposase InsO family protein